MTKRVCSKPGCPTLVVHSSDNRCDACKRVAEYVRGTSSQRGYGSEHRRTFRSQVLGAQPACVICGDSATVADHYPLSRRELVARGANPNDPKYGRSLCVSCHASQTALRQPGGFRA